MIRRAAIWAFAFAVSLAVHSAIMAAVFDLVSRPQSSPVAELFLGEESAFSAVVAEPVAVETAKTIASAMATEQIAAVEAGDEQGGVKPVTSDEPVTRADPDAESIAAVDHGGQTALATKAEELKGQASGGENGPALQSIVPTDDGAKAVDSLDVAHAREEREQQTLAPVDQRQTSQTGETDLASRPAPVDQDLGSVAPIDQNQVALSSSDDDTSELTAVDQATTGRAPVALSENRARASDGQDQTPSSLDEGERLGAVDHATAALQGEQSGGERIAAIDLAAEASQTEAAEAATASPVEEGSAVQAMTNVGGSDQPAAVTTGDTFQPSQTAPAAGEPAQPIGSQPILPVEPSVAPESVEQKQALALPPVSVPPISAPAERLSDRMREFLRSYDGGNCFFALPVALEGPRPRIDGFGTRRESLEQFGAAFRRELEIDVDLGVREITDPQCPALGFIGPLLKARSPDIRVYLESDTIATGSQLRGSLDGVHLNHVSLLLVDDDGMVQDVSTYLSRGPRGYAFSAPVYFTAEGKARNQLIVSIAADVELGFLKGMKPMKADRFFPTFVREVFSARGKIEIGMGAFRVQ